MQWKVTDGRQCGPEPTKAAPRPDIASSKMKDQYIFYCTLHESRASFIKEPEYGAAKQAKNHTLATSRAALKILLLSGDLSGCTTLFLTSASPKQSLVYTLHLQQCNAAEGTVLWALSQEVSAEGF